MKFIRPALTLLLVPATFALAALAYPVWAQSDADMTRRSITQMQKDTGVYNRPATARTPNFASDPGWPQVLPNSWRLGQVSGLFVDHHDHIWVLNRPRSMTDQESGLEGPVPGATNETGVPINGLGFARPYGPTSDCCKAAPSVLAFDASGKLPTGETFRDIHEMKRLLAANPRQLARNLLHHLTLHATGTPVGFADRAEIEAMLDGCAAAGYRVRDLVHALVRSSIFLGSEISP